MSDSVTDTTQVQAPPEDVLLDILQDISALRATANQLTDLAGKGFQVGDGPQRLTTQADNLTQFMEARLQQIKDVLDVLKQHDDRLDSATQPIIVIGDYATADNTAKIYMLKDYMRDLLTSLHDDKNKLQEIKTIINGYRNLGVQLGTAVSTLDIQSTDIDGACMAAQADVSRIIEELRVESSVVDSQV